MPKTPAQCSAAAEKVPLRETMLGALEAEMKELQRQADAISVQLEAIRHRRDTASQVRRRNSGARQLPGKWWSRLPQGARPPVQRGADP